MLWVHPERYRELIKQGKVGDHIILRLQRRLIDSPFWLWFNRGLALLILTIGLLLLFCQDDCVISLVRP